MRLTHEVGTAHTDKEKISRNRTGKGVRIAGIKFTLEATEYKSSTFENTTDGKLDWEEVCESTTHSLESVLLFDKVLRQSFTGANTKSCVLRLAHWLE